MLSNHVWPDAVYIYIYPMLGLLGITTKLSFHFKAQQHSAIRLYARLFACITSVICTLCLQEAPHPCYNVTAHSAYVCCYIQGTHPGPCPLYCERELIASSRFLHCRLLWPCFPPRLFRVERESPSCTLLGLLTVQTVGEEYCVYRLYLYFCIWMDEMPFGFD